MFVNTLNDSDIEQYRYKCGAKKNDATVDLFQLGILMQKHFFLLFKDVEIKRCRPTVKGAYGMMSCLGMK